MYDTEPSEARGKQFIILHEAPYFMARIRGAVLRGLDYIRHDWPEQKVQTFKRDLKQGTESTERLDAACGL